VSLDVKSARGNKNDLYDAGGKAALPLRSSYGSIKFFRSPYCAPDVCVHVFFFRRVNGALRRPFRFQRECHSNIGQPLQTHRRTSPLTSVLTIYLPRLSSPFVFFNYNRETRICILHRTPNTYFAAPRRFARAISDVRFRDTRIRTVHTITDARVYLFVLFGPNEYLSRASYE